MLKTLNIVLKNLFIYINPLFNMIINRFILFLNLRKVCLKIISLIFYRIYQKNINPNNIYLLIFFSLINIIN
jgi:hypothetical protein